MKFCEIPDKRLIAACGLNCEVCSAHVREKNVCPGCKYLTGEENRKSCKIVPLEIVQQNEDTIGALNVKIFHVKR